MIKDKDPFEKLSSLDLPKIWPDRPEDPDLKAWEKRRIHLRDLLAENVYGSIPRFEGILRSEIVKETKEAFAGKANWKKIKLTMDMPEGEFSFPLDLIIPDPVDETPEKKFPLFIHIAFRPEIPDRYLPAEEMIDAGFAIANFCYQDIVPDTDDDFTEGLPAYMSLEMKKADRPGKISMWAWAASRVMDFIDGEIKNNAPIDPDNIAVIGHSRLGKTALWAGANDTRFSIAISNESGCAGAALERGKTGQHVKEITKTFPYWFTPEYFKYVSDSGNMPFDHHFLLAANAPRRVYVSSASEDHWSDPDAEFLSCVAASEAYEFLGYEGFITENTWPGDDHVAAKGRIAYHRRPGMHYFSRTDWIRFMSYIKGSVS